MKREVYYTAIGNGPYRARVYRYADDLSTVVTLHRSAEVYPSVAKAIDAACQWCEDNGYSDAVLDDPADSGPF